MKPTFMIRIVSVLLASCVFSLVLCAGDEVPPASMQDHQKWARSATDIGVKIKRLESFWAKYLPSEEGGIDPEHRGYEDATHALAVAGCAWDLVKAYIQAGQKEKALRMLDWVQRYDSKSMLVDMTPKTQPTGSNPASSKPVDNARAKD